MGLFDKIFGKSPKPKGDYEGVFRVLTGYTPQFTSWGGSIYESELVRSAIEAKARHISSTSHFRTTLKLATASRSRHHLRIRSSTAET